MQYVEKVSAKFSRNKLNVLKPATSHRLPNKAFVSMIKMSNLVLLTMVRSMSTFIHYSRLLAKKTNTGCIPKFKVEFK